MKLDKSKSWLGLDSYSRLMYKVNNKGWLKNDCRKRI